MIYLGDYSRVWDEKKQRFVVPAFRDVFMDRIRDGLCESIDIRDRQRDDQTTLNEIFSDLRLQASDLNRAYCHIERLVNV